MRAADTYRAARRNLRGPGDQWLGVRPGRYPRKEHNAAKLKKPSPSVAPLALISPLMLGLMVRAGMTAHAV